MLFTDRYLLLRGITTLIVVIALVMLVVIGMDLILNLNTFLRGAEQLELGLLTVIGRYYGYSLPSMVSPLLPLALVIALVATCAPMLKRGEFIALSASGVSLRHATRSLLVLALAIGALDVVINDRVAPHFEAQRAALDDQLSQRWRSARVWQVADGRSHWYANTVMLHDNERPVLQDIIAVSPIRMIQAKSLEFAEGQWWLRGPLVEWRLDDEGFDRVSGHQGLVAEDDLELNLSPQALSQLLISRHARNGPELLREGGHLNLSLLAGRWARLLLPLSMALLALSVFVRFTNHDRITVAALRAILVSLLPLFIISMGTMTNDSSALNPLLRSTIFVSLALAPGLWAYGRWKL